MTLSTKMIAQIVASQHSDLDLAARSMPLNYLSKLILGSGTGADQADQVWSDQRTIAASDDEDLDLAGSLTDAFGTTLTFARLKGIIVAAAAGNTNDVEVTRPATNGVPLFLAAEDGIAVKPGGVFACFARDAVGYPVTAGTGDLLTITNSAGGSSVTYDVVIVGASA